MTRNISGKNMVCHKMKDIFIIFSWQGTGLRGSYAQVKVLPGVSSHYGMLACGDPMHR